MVNIKDASGVAKPAINFIFNAITNYYQAASGQMPLFNYRNI